MRPTVPLQVRVPVAIAERVKKLASEQNITATDLLIRLIGTDEDDATSRRSQATPTKVR
jgi:hypothetical protein